MPPRYAYWTILVDEQPTAFRAGDREDLQPTFKRLKEKHPSARMVWFQNGKIWDSRLDAQEAMRARGEMGRRGDARQGGRYGDRSPRPEQGERRDASGKLDWQPKDPTSSRKEAGFSKPDYKRRRDARPEKLDWQPKGHASAARDRKPRFKKPEWEPKAAGRTPSNRIKGGFRRPNGDRRPPMREGGKLEWKPKGSESDGGGRHSAAREGGKPSRPREKRKWIPKEEFNKSKGIEARRDKNWRPGGEHKDPRQKYKDAKKAKWTRFKQTVRKRWESKQGRKKKNGE
jgi:hypothetical protein